MTTQHERAVLWSLRGARLTASQQAGKVWDWMSASTWAPSIRNIFKLACAHLDTVKAGYYCIMQEFLGLMRCYYWFASLFWPHLISLNRAQQKVLTVELLMQVQHHWEGALGYPGGWPSLWDYIWDILSLSVQRDFGMSGRSKGWCGTPEPHHLTSSYVFVVFFFCLFFTLSLLGAVSSVHRGVNLQNSESNNNLEQVGKFSITPSAMGLTRNKSPTAKFNLGLFAVHILCTVYLCDSYIKPYRIFFVRQAGCCRLH